MTAPGNSIVLFVLLAAFLTCTGYAAGRLHQWYRMGRDRDEAYRDGYDTATRSVFSMAARIISPRRGDRAAIRASAAVVLPASAVIETSASPLPASPNDPARPITFGTRLGSKPSLSPRDARSAPATRSFSHDVPSARTSFSDVPPGVAADLSSGFAPEVRAALASDVPSDVAPFASAADVAAEQSGSSGSSGAGPAAPAGGRHLVPDELVRADTYRLPPDRVARAKVHRAATPSDSAADPAWRVPPVPKPRSNGPTP